jgi:hypothetical protein
LLLAARHLVLRLRHAPSRAAEVAEVHRRLERARPAGGTDAARAVALELAELRERLHAALAGTTSCGGCAVSYPEPHGHWPGGYCCGGPTEGVFTDDELAALGLAGTRPRDLVPPPGDHAGCAFRAADGCSLEARHRPSVCVLYVCRGLERELRERGKWQDVSRLRSQMQHALARFRQSIDRTSGEA